MAVVTSLMMKDSRRIAWPEGPGMEYVRQPLVAGSMRICFERMLSGGAEGGEKGQLVQMLGLQNRTGAGRSGHCDKTGPFGYQACN